MIYRDLYHFSVARQKGLAHDPVKYFAAPENQDLGVIKQKRKRKVHGEIVAPFPTKQRGSRDFFLPTFCSNPLDFCFTALTCHQWPRINDQQNLSLYNQESPQILIFLK
jgi:hypothetical protein